MNIDLLLYIGLFILSIAVLLKASDWFIDSSEEIGLSLGISPFIIGVTIIAFGTSLPELATSVASVFANESEIVIGNVIGSNITNIALVFGLIAVYHKVIKIETDMWNIDMPFLWASAFMLWFFIQDQNVSIFEAILLLAGLVIFLTYSLKSDENGKEENRPKASPKSYFLLIIGGVLVWLGATFTIESVKVISIIGGIDPEIIALTAIALGTSLPEVVVSLNAARKGKTSIAIGNVLGSNVFNTFVVIGIPRFLGDLKIPLDILSFSLPLMMVMTFLFGIMTISRTISRWEGLVLLIFYLYFMVEVYARGLGN